MISAEAVRELDSWKQGLHMWSNPEKQQVLKVFQRFTEFKAERMAFTKVFNNIKIDGLVW